MERPHEVTNDGGFCSLLEYEHVRRVGYSYAGPHVFVYTFLVLNGVDLRIIHGLSSKVHLNDCKAASWLFDHGLG